MEIVKSVSRLGLFLVVNCCVLLLLMAACLPRSAHAEEELWWAISFEWENAFGEKNDRWFGGGHPSYGAAWNFKTAEKAQFAANKACRDKARNAEFHESSR